jgi:CHAT domain-containing protein
MGESIVQVRGFLPLAAALMLGLAGCQPAPLPIEQAKRITAEFQNDSFVPPPRTIDDITSILDQQKPDPARAEDNRKTADALPPEGATPGELTRFYFDRALAAAELGRATQRVSDLREAARIGRENGIFIDRIMNALFSAESEMGNGESALKAAHEWQLTIPAASYGEAMGSFLKLSSIFVALGDRDAAEQALATAQARFETARSAVGKKSYGTFYELWLSQQLRARATFAVSRGDLEEAESNLRQAAPNTEIALQKYEQMLPFELYPSPRQTLESNQTNTMLALADVLRLEGKLLEAEVQARRSLLLLLERRSRYAPETAEAVVSLARIIGEQGRYVEAEKLGLAAVATYETLGADEGSWRLEDARIAVAASQAAQDHWDDASTTFQAIERGLANDQLGRDRFVDSNPTLAVVYLNTGRADLALAIARRLTKTRANMFGADNVETAEARGLLAIALADSGDVSGAKREFSQSVPTLLSQIGERSDQETASATQDRIHRDILESYMGVLAADGGAAAAQTAFGLIDAAHGASTARALIESTARATIADPALAEIVRRFQNTRLQITALQSSLADILAHPIGEQDAAGSTGLRTEIAQLSRARTSLRQEIAQRFPDYARLVDPPPTTFDDVRKSLRAGEALVATHTAKDRLFLWAVPKNGQAALATVPLGDSDLQGMVAVLRRALNPNVSKIGDIPSFDVALAYKLYATLLKPVEAGWKGAKTLIVVPDNVLAQIPWALLVTAPAETPHGVSGEALFAGYKRVPFLVRQVAVAQLPSVAALGTLRALPPGNASRRQFVGFGDPWFNLQEAAEAKSEQPVQVAGLDQRGFSLRAPPATEKLKSADLSILPRLPDTAVEVREVAAALKADLQQDVFLGAAANEQQVQTMRLDDRRVVMFATHGLLPGDLDGLTQPALALSAPAVTGVGGDGLLTLEKILALKLDADWVVLSACNTAEGEGKGAEAVSGLGRAFFYAGARALLVTNWPVETTSARLLTTGTFRHQATDGSLTRAEALRQTELDLIDGPGFVDADGRTDFSYAHPLFWAPFSLIGDGG